MCPSLLCVSCNLSVRLQGQARGRKAAAGRWRHGVCEHHVQGRCHCGARPVRHGHKPQRSWRAPRRLRSVAAGKRATPKLRCKRHIAHRERGKHFARQMVHLNKKRLRQAKGCRRRFPLFVRKARAPFWPRKRKRCIFLPVSAILKQTEGSKAYDI